MTVVSLNAGTTTASTAIGFSTVYNTNNNITADGTVLKITQPGLYEIQGIAQLTSNNGTTAANYGVYISVNGNQSGAQAVSYSTVASEQATVPVYSTINVVTTPQSGYVTVSILPVNAPTVVGGTISIKKIN